MSRVALALVAAVLLILAPTAAAQTPPPLPSATPPALPTDADGDGVQDAVDQCAYTPGTINGCPDPDFDHDGFLNESDRCPTVAGSIKGCPTDPDPPPTTNTPEVPTATSVGAPSAGIKKYGQAFQFSGSIIANGFMSPRRLTIWLPKGIKVSGAPLKPCSQAYARSMGLDGSKRCAKIFAGRLNDEDVTAYFAYAGPKVGNRQRLWLRGRSGDDLARFGTGWIEPAKGAFGPKLTLELGELALKTRTIELYSGAERGVKPLQGKCTGKYRVRLDTAQGSADKTFRC